MNCGLFFSNFSFVIFQILHFFHFLVNSIPSERHPQGRYVVVTTTSSQLASAGDRAPRKPSCDGGVAMGLPEDVALQLVHPLDHSFYQACRSKLGWGSRLVRVDD